MSAKKIEKLFLQVYDTHADAIFRHCYFRVRNNDHAQEIMQDAFMKTWQYLSEGKDIQNIRAFVYKTATNLIIDDARKKKEQSLDIMQDAGFEPSITTKDHLHNKIEVQRVLSVLEQLEESYREVVYLRYVDELPPREIAEILNDSVNSVSVRIHRGMKQLRNILKEHI